MKILVLGIGKIGTVLLKDLANCDEVSEVVAADMDVGAVKRTLEYLKSPKIRAERVDVKDTANLKSKLSEGFDVVASTLPYLLNYDVIKTSIEAGVNYTDVNSAPWDLHKLAVDAGVTVLPCIGLDPGIDRVMEGAGVAQLDKVKKIHMYCGGFPQKGTAAYSNPIRYKISWDWNAAIDSYLGSPDLKGGKRGKTKILRGGELVEVDVLSGPGNPEPIKFPEPLGDLEAFYTGAPMDTIRQLGLGDVEEAWEKTVRWPGHCQIWGQLRDLHLLDHEPLTVNGQKVEPRDILIEIGKAYLQYEKGEGDAAVIRVEVVGEKDGKPVQYTYELMDFYDPISDITSMGRTTAFPCSIASQMIARGDIKERGVFHPAKIGRDPSLLKKFFDQLTKRNIHIYKSATIMVA
jgi:lysine 6-dehydrogenase